MEAALLSGVLKIAADKLGSLISSEFDSIMSIKKDLSELQDMFGEITSRLSAIGDRATGSHPPFHWLGELKDVAYDFDDLLNKVHLEADKHKVDIDGDKHVMANCFCAKPKSALSRFEMAHEIKKIKKRFSKIVKQRSDVNAIAKSLVVEHPVQHTNKTIGEMSILVNIDETKIFGRDEVKHKIVCKLVEADSKERISIISIVGLGGSGKTTLAKYICQDNKIKDHFEVTFWVHVSQEFNVQKLIAKLFESVSDQKSELHTLQHMSRAISEKLSGKKFLLVFDDVWNEDKHEWEEFEQYFSSGATGSKILLTTRDLKVAEVVKSKEIVNLPLLSDDDSWKLFQQSSGWAEEGLGAEFIEVGKEIMKKCAGVPLAIKSLGGILYGKREIKEWWALRDDNLLTDMNIHGRVLGSLKLSYLQLSDDLKLCFVLCSIFPKGCCMYKHHLISQWIAHGFINPMNGGRQPEDIGSDYFDSLLKISFLQDLVEDECTGQLKCKMHDLVHDLTRQILQDEVVFSPNKTSTGHNQRCRYLSLASCTEKVDRKLFNKVRALYVTGGSFATDKPIKKACCVRSVIMERISDTSFPLFILKFEYLGYLRISHVKCRKLPEVITGCWNLQALHILHCSQFEMLPESIGKLRKLRTLELSWADDLVSLPQSIGDCGSLESLHLTNCRNFKQIPDSIAKNDKLRFLNIRKCGSLRQLPSESFEMLRNLQTIDLNGCLSLEDLPISFSSLSNLEHLDLGYCKELVELPEGIVNLKRLQVLNLEGCFKLCGLPARFGQLTRLRRLGLFVVGDSTEHAKISELGNLDMVSGKLEIKGIKYVKDPNDAEKAYLKKKNNIQELILNWSMSNGDQIGTSTEEEVDMGQELGVLNGLEPPYGIKELEIHNYQGLHLPCWMATKRHFCNLDGRFKQIPHLPHLTSMKLYYFHNLKHLSGFVGFPSLKTITLCGFEALESINAGPFPSLTELVIFGMPSLLELSTTAAECVGIFGWNQEVRCCFPRLSALQIEDCSKLNVKPWFPASLESLTLQRSNEWLLSPGSSSCSLVHVDGGESESPSFCSNSNGASYLSLLKKLTIYRMRGPSFQWKRRMTGPSPGSGLELLRHLTALESLEIVGCTGLRQLPESMRSLTCLQQLSIYSWSGLRGLPGWLGELRSLQSLQISYCRNLREFPEGIQQLTSLQTLYIKYCGALEQLPEGLGGLLSLRSLAISKLRCLPESMRGLTSLQRLQIGSCDSLHRLPEWLGELHSLQALEIWDLPALTCLPESMQRLTSLHHLDIYGCDALTVLPEWIGQLSALQSLEIWRCSGITSLPSSIRRLAALQKLEIHDNPDLARRCKQGKGEDWHLISHIPNVRIGW